MLAPQARDQDVVFSRRDLTRLAIASFVLIAILTAILAIDLVPHQAGVQLGNVARTSVTAPKAITFQSAVQTEQKRQEARDSVADQYDFTQVNANAVAAAQVGALRRAVIPVDRAFNPTTPADTRRSLLEQSLTWLTDEQRGILARLDAKRWAAVRDEAFRVLDTVERRELRESRVAEARAELPDRFAADLDPSERALGAAILQPFVISNSSYSEELTSAERQRRADAVAPVVVSIRQGQVIARSGDLITDREMEMIQRLGLDDPAPDVAAIAGSFLLIALLVALLLGWVWRFRRELWHRNNVLFLVGLVLVLATFAMRVTAGSTVLPYLMPVAAVPMLIAVLLDAGAATVVLAVIAVIAGVVNGSSLEVTAYVFIGGFAAILAIRRGDRLQVFVQAGVAVFVVNALVVSTFSLLGARDVTGVVQLWGASAAAAGGSAVAAVGSFAVLGNLFEILTVFQLLELANPSQPLLRRLLVETPGTYHHSIMVGNLAERAAEAIGADPLLTRVAAYYHDVGKLANPLAFIENQAGGENIHDQLEPEVSAQILKQHVADGIDIAYQGRLPKALIAFIPQHHGTAIMSYFHARAREAAAAAHGGLATADGRSAADGVDPRRFRHAGPKPQSREAALIMLADGVEASVRSLSSRDEAAIRAMVSRIIEERLSDGQFDECDLTLRDVERIREAFVGQLLGMYHTRIAYPQNKVVELESRRGTGTGA
jgi:putative nucleotidyltransferase with HDIG domain